MMKKKFLLHPVRKSFLQIILGDYKVGPNVWMLSSKSFNPIRDFSIRILLKPPIFIIYLFSNPTLSACPAVDSHVWLTQGHLSFGTVFYLFIFYPGQVY